MNQCGILTRVKPEFIENKEFPNYRGGNLCICESIYEKKPYNEWKWLYLSSHRCSLPAATDSLLMLYKYYFENDLDELSYWIGLLEDINECFIVRVQNVNWMGANMLFMRLLLPQTKEGLLSSTSNYLYISPQIE
jgi:hypothetical protein